MVVHGKTCAVRIYLIVIARFSVASFFLLLQRTARADCRSLKSPNELTNRFNRC